MVHDGVGHLDHGRQPALPGQIHPGPEQGGPLMAVLDGEDLLEGQAHSIGECRLEIAVLEAVELFPLPRLEVIGVLEPDPAGLFEVGLGERLQAADLIHGFIDELYQVETVDGDPGLGQVFGDPFLEGGGQVHAHRFDGLGITPMGLEIFRKGWSVWASLPEVAKSRHLAGRSTKRVM